MFCTCLHRLVHPRGEADQLHKCIAAAASARGVFDGNVRVERAAQQTDARQLSRNLLLVPKVCSSLLLVVLAHATCRRRSTSSQICRSLQMMSSARTGVRSVTWRRSSSSTFWPVASMRSRPGRRWSTRLVQRWLEAWRARAWLGGWSRLSRACLRVVSECSNLHVYVACTVLLR